MTKTPEYSANVKLAELLREVCDIGCEAESAAGSKRPDVRIEGTSEWIGIECKWHGDDSGEGQCEAHARTLVNGKPIRVVAAVQYPKGLEDVPESGLKNSLRKTDQIQVRTGEVSEGKIQWTQSARMVSVEQLGAVLNERYVAWERDTDQVDRVVSHLEAAAEEAAEILSDKESTRREVSRVLNLDRLSISEDAQARAAVLVFANALVLHELLAPYVDGVSPRRRGESRSETRGKWGTILEVNWLPVMEPAAQALDRVAEPAASRILDCLQPSAEHLARCGVGQQHDLAGRVFHRLLIGGKHLSPNYTTLPAATMLAELAFDGVERGWADLDDIKGLRVGDPACGTGTLLVAAAEAIRRRHAERAGRADAALNRILIEEVLWGRDVVVAVIHLAAATLCLYRPQDRIDRTNLRTMPLEVQIRGNSRVARLGALDLLPDPKTGNAYEEESLPLHASQDQLDPAKRTAEAAARLGEELDIAILNPPFFKSAGNVALMDGRRTWKPFYGLMTSPKDAADMRKELSKRLKNTPARMRAGGSAFALLADERLKKDGGILAIVLPANVITGSDWSAMRELWHDGYEIEWVMVSHDSRNRTATQSTPGRRYVSFSESTRIAEVMIVARKTRIPANPRHIKVVNLVHNPDMPADAQAVARTLAAMDDKNIPHVNDGTGQIAHIRTAGTNRVWGEVVRANRTGNEWDTLLAAASALTDTELVQTAIAIAATGKTNGGIMPVCRVEELAHTGPRDLQIKGREAPCEIDEQWSGSGLAAIWHHKADAIFAMLQEPNARLWAKMGRQREFDELAQKKGRLHIATELGHAPQSVGAVLTSVEALGVASWNTLLLKDRRTGADEALALWWNSSLGLLVRICFSNRPYLGRSRLPIESIRRLPVLDVREISETTLAVAEKAFNRLANRRLQGFAEMVSDTIRHEVDTIVAANLLGWGSEGQTWIEMVRQKLSRQPTTFTRF